jgi:hypothetical protein
MSSFSGFPMILPFFLIGAGEVLVNPPLLHFIYDQVPPRARSLAQVSSLPPEMLRKHIPGERI